MLSKTIKEIKLKENESNGRGARGALCNASHPVPWDPGICFPYLWGDDPELDPPGYRETIYIINTDDKFRMTNL